MRSSFLAVDCLILSLTQERDINSAVTESASGEVPLHTVSIRLDDTVTRRVPSLTTLEPVIRFTVDGTPEGEISFLVILESGIQDPVPAPDTVTRLGRPSNHVICDEFGRDTNEMNNGQAWFHDLIIPNLGISSTMQLDTTRW